MEGRMEIFLSLSEAYAIQSIIRGLEGLTGGICRDFGVNNLELLSKLEEATDRFLFENRPGDYVGYRG